MVLGRFFVFKLTNRKGDDPMRKVVSFLFQ